MLQNPYEALDMLVEMASDFISEVHMWDAAANKTHEVREAKRVVQQELDKAQGYEQMQRALRRLYEEAIRG